MATLTSPVHEHVDFGPASGWDVEWVDKQFNAIIAANWGSEPPAAGDRPTPVPQPEVPRPYQAPEYRPEAAPERPGEVTGHQRSPPPRSTDR